MVDTWAAARSWAQMGATVHLSGPTRATGPRGFAGGEFGLGGLVIIPRLEAGQRSDAAPLKDLLREHGISA